MPDEYDYVQPTLTVGYGWLHLEARYNYEALDTSPAWVGYNISGGEKFAWELTPMVGGVFAPGIKAHSIIVIQGFVVVARLGMSGK